MALQKTDLGDDHFLFYDSAMTNTVLKDIMGGPCILKFGTAYNGHASAVAVLKFFDNIAPTLGTTEPIESYVVDDTGSTSAGFTGFAIIPDGLTFENGLSVAASLFDTTANPLEEGGAAGAVAPTTALVVSLIVKKGT